MCSIHVCTCNPHIVRAVVMRALPLQCNQMYILLHNSCKSAKNDFDIRLKCIRSVGEKEKIFVLHSGEWNRFNSVIVNSLFFF